MRQKKNRVVLRAILFFVMFWGAGSGVAAERITVFAAASLKTALDAVAEDYPGEVTLVYAGSSALARQIAAGAPADVFISANPDWMDDLAARGRIDTAGRVDLLGNSLVAIAPRGAMPEAPFEADRVAMALTEAVPAGIYGKAALQHLELWDVVAPRVVQTDNVRVALALVALGEAPLGIVYATDALAEPRVDVVFDFPSESHPPIRYPAAPVIGGDDGGFLAYLQGPEARAIFAVQGFEVLQ